MSRDEIESTVRLVMSTILNTSFDNNPEISKQNTSSWDSLKHMEIFFSLEDELGVEFTDDELSSLDSVAKIIDCIEKKNAT